MECSPKLFRHEQRPATFGDFGFDVRDLIHKSKSLDRPVTFADFGVDVEKEKPIVHTAIGTCRKLSNLDCKEKVFVCLSLFTMLFCIGLTIERLLIVDIQSSNFTFVLLVLVNCVFCVYYVVHAVLREHPWELFAFGTVVLMVLAICIANYILTYHHTQDHVKLVRLVLISCVAPFVLALAIKIGINYHRARNLIFRTVGANLQLQHICGKMYLFADLQKFDLQLQISMLVLVLKEGASLNLFEEIVLGVGIPLGLIWNVLGYISVWRESKSLVAIYLSTSWIFPAYILYKYIDIGYDWLPTSSKLLPTCIIICGTLAFIIRVWLVGVIVFLYRHFGHALGNKVFGSGRNWRNSSGMEIKTFRPKSSSRLSSVRLKTWPPKFKKSLKDKRRSERDLIKERPESSTSRDRSSQTDTSSQVGLIMEKTNPKRNDKKKTMTLSFKITKSDGK
ncbi:uncharacterized protein LOC117100404 [Anneissia japonica]|uniref:uncharacterized protein LOC117100404 n=1 Tax=Anneissia japonica TaxID=1529436 RepID=UPI0014256707|nr:uncharacterized protein LOC117100404 [Anneissia japonica]